MRYGSDDPRVLDALARQARMVGEWRRMVGGWAGRRGVRPVIGDRSGTLGVMEVIGVRACPGAGGMPEAWVDAGGGVLTPVVESRAWWELHRLRLVMPVVPGLPWRVDRLEDGWMVPCHPMPVVRDGRATVLLPAGRWEAPVDMGLWRRVDALTVHHD